MGGTCVLKKIFFLTGTLQVSICQVGSGLAAEGLGLVGNLAEWVRSTVLLDTPMMDYSVFKSSM